MIEDEKINRFHEWLTTNGAKYPKIQWPASTSLGRGAIALEDIEPNEVMVEIPSTLMLSPLTAIRNPNIGDILKEVRHTILSSNDDVILSIILMHEMLKSEQSFFWPYFAILPDQVDSVCSWEDSELNELQCSRMIMRAKSRATFIKVQIFHHDRHDDDDDDVESVRANDCEAFGRISRGLLSAAVFFRFVFILVRSLRIYSCN